MAGHGLGICTVSESTILEAVAYLYQRCGVVAECTAAVPIAAILEERIGAVSGATVVVISGGNIDADALDEILSSRMRSDETNL